MQLDVAVLHTKGSFVFLCHPCQVQLDVALLHTKGWFVFCATFDMFEPDLLPIRCGAAFVYMWDPYLRPVALYIAACKKKQKKIKKIKK